MKKEEIIIVRVDKLLKNRIKEHCNIKNTTISEVIINYLNNLVEPMSHEITLVHEQYKNSKILTKNLLNKIKSKHFFSGRKKKIGDKILFGFLMNKNKIEMIDFHIDEVNTKYKILIDNDNPTNFPHFTLNNE